MQAIVARRRALDRMAPSLTFVGMDKPNDPRPAITDDGRRRAGERAARQAAALRANLRKRKAQRRGRDDDPAGSAQEQGGD